MQLKLDSKANSTLHEYFLYAWFFTFFFGAKIGRIDLGYFTLYPNLVLTFLYFPFTLFYFKNLSIFQKSYIGILLSLFLISAIWHINHPVTFYSKFEIRSLINNILTFLVVSSNFLANFDKNRFKKVVVNSIWIYLSLVIAFGYFEHFTGIHIDSEVISRIKHLASDKIHYAPMFIYENPNDFIVYAISFFILLIILDPNLKEIPDRILLISILLLYLANAAESRLAMLVLVFFIFVVLLRWIWSRKLFRKHVLSIIIACAALFLFLIFSVKVNGVYWGKNQKENFNSNFSFLFHSLNGRKSAEKKVNRDGSNEIRVKLIKNGISLFKSSPIFGVGPGQFEILTLEKKVPFDTNKYCNPHNFFIEMIANFGTFGIVFFLFFGVLIFILLKYKVENYFWKIVSLAIFFILSIIPSSFIYQPINWLFFALWLVVFEFDIKKIWKTKAI